MENGRDFPQSPYLDEVDGIQESFKESHRDTVAFNRPIHPSRIRDMTISRQGCQVTRKNNSFGDEYHPSNAESRLLDIGSEKSQSGHNTDSSQVHVDTSESEISEETDFSEEWRKLDPELMDLAEEIMDRELRIEHQVSSSWTTCFTATDIARVEKVYLENEAAANSGPFIDGRRVDRCSCIVMLNVALGQLLSLPLKLHPARGRPKTSRRVLMGNLTTHSIESAMAQLRRRGNTGAPAMINFFDRRNRTAGTLRPERLQSSVEGLLASLSSAKGCWFAFGLSILDGYHSVLLLADNTSEPLKTYWLDQYSDGLSVNVSGLLDDRLTADTQTYWDEVGYRTTIRLWQLRKQGSPNTP